MLQHAGSYYATLVKETGGGVIRTGSDVATADISSGQGSWCSAPAAAPPLRPTEAAMKFNPKLLTQTRESNLCLQSLNWVENIYIF